MTPVGMSEPNVKVTYPTSPGLLEDQAAETIPKGKGSEEMTSEKMKDSEERADEEEHGKGSEEMKVSEDRKGRGEIDKVSEEIKVSEEVKSAELDRGLGEMEDPEVKKSGEPDKGLEEMTYSEERKDAGPDKGLEDGEQDKGFKEMKESEEREDIEQDKCTEEMKDIIERDDAEGKGKYLGKSDSEERKVKEDDEKNEERREEIDEVEEEIQKDYVEMVETLDTREEMDDGERKDGEVKEDEEESGARREGTDEGEEDETEKEDVEMVPAGDAKDEEKVAEGGDEEEGEKPCEDNDVEEEKNSGDEEKVDVSKKTAMPKKKRARGGRVSSNGNKKEKNERVMKAEPPRTPAPSSMERPVRERKTVERLVQVVDKEQTKEFLIEKGRGTQLKDIPNVAYKLAKKKSADLKLLHQTLFGRRGKVINFKNHILQFSGFALHEDDEKQKTKMKEKLEKYVKDILVDFCELFDIHVLKATTRKEDIVAKLVDFMVAPHAMTDVILAEKDQLSSKSRKRKRVSRNTGGTSEKSSIKKHAKDEDTPNTKSKRAEESEDEDKEEDEKDDQNELSDENGSPEHSDNDEKKNESDEEVGEADESPKKRQQVKKTSLGDLRSDKKEKRSRTSPMMVPLKSVNNPAKSSSTKLQAEESNDTGEKVFSRKRKAVDAPAMKSGSKPDNKERVTGKRSSTGKVTSEEDKQSRPSKDELRVTICEILKGINFNTATFNDMVELLSKSYKTDLTPRKSVIKKMIKEELTKLAEEAADEEEAEDVAEEIKAMEI